MEKARDSLGSASLPCLTGAVRPAEGEGLVTEELGVDGGGRGRHFS